MTLKAIFRVDATPGFEDAVEDALAADEAVVATARLKHGNDDLVALVETQDEDTLQRLFTNRLRTITGVHGFHRLENPDDEVWTALGSSP